MLDLLTVYCFDEAGWFSHESLAQRDPFTDQFDMPQDSTTVEPELDPAYFYRWNGESWESVAKPTTVEDCVGIVVSHESQTAHDIELRSLLESLAQTSEKYRVGRGEDLSWFVEPVPEQTPEEKKLSRIAELKSNLSSTDYVVAKIAEGVATKEEYAQVLADRQGWRAEINALEAELNKA